jgi:hypothetical protein
VSHNPCRNVTHGNNGQYCGTSTQGGFSTPDASPNIVYECFDGQVANETRCPAGCFVAPAGSPDACNGNGNASDPCAQVAHGNNGTYCSSSTQNGFNAEGTAVSGSVYSCVDGVTAHVSACAAGCVVAPSGQPDSCVNDPCTAVSPGDNGRYCGRSNQAGFNLSAANPLTVYNCVNGRSLDSGACKSGCFIAGAGSPDGCNQDPCAGVSSGNSGVYCGTSTQTGFAAGLADSKTLYSCVGGRTQWTQACARGCTVAAAGHADACN